MMNPSAITIEATLLPDGQTLQLSEKLALPPGRVRVRVEASAQKSGPTMLEVLERIHRDQQQRGQRPMTEEEMATEIAQMRSEDNEYEASWREIWSRTERTDPP